MFHPPNGSDVFHYVLYLEFLNYVGVIFVGFIFIPAMNSYLHIAVSARFDMASSVLGAGVTFSMETLLWTPF